jgi:uncharacterized damage-inducible protein DinB
MQADEIRFLFAYDRWATRRILAALDGVDQPLRAGTHAVGDRSLGAVLVHQLGASQRWRMQFEAEGDATFGRLEDEPLPTMDHLRDLWDQEWAAVDAWLPAVTDAFVNHVYEGVPIWQMLAHVVNHGTQHRAEAATLMTAAGHSPGEVDMIDFAEEQARAGEATP